MGDSLVSLTHLEVDFPRMISCQHILKGNKHWLVVWNMAFNFPYIGNVIIPTDELIFFRGVGLNHQPGRDRNRWIPFIYVTLLVVQAERMSKMIKDLAAGKSYDLGPACCF